MHEDGKMNNDVQNEMYKISVTPEGVQIRTYIYDKNESDMNGTPTYRTDEEDSRWLKPKNVKIGEIVNRSVVCDKAGILNAVKLLYVHFSEQLEKKTQELRELTDKVGHLKNFIAKEIMVKNCKLCGCNMVWENPHIPGHFQASSCDIEDWHICHECMVEHCCQTTCLGCEYGKYPDCRFLEMKRHNMKKD